MKKILIISGSYPNYGGQSTTAYNLLKLLKDKNYSAKLVYVNYHKEADVDPDKTGSSHRIVLKKSFINILYNWYKNNVNVPLGVEGQKVKNYYFFFKLLLRFKYFQLSKGFRPDLVITNIPSYFWLVQKIFRNRKLLFVIGSSPEMIMLSKHKVDTTTFLQDSSVAEKKKIKPNELIFDKTNIVFNSRLTKEVYDKFGIQTGSSFVQYFNFAPYKKEHTTPIANRTNSMAFVASHFNRTIKNADLAFDIFSAFPEVEKLAIGKESERFATIPNTAVYELMTQQDIMQHLADTKVLLITSYFDSSPSVLSEAILSGCNVLVSKNVGWHDMLDERCVVQHYDDVNEWKEKAAYLMQHKIDYSRFEEVIASSTASIIANIQSVLDK